MWIRIALRSTKEAEVRSEFIDPFFEALGWQTSFPTVIGGKFDAVIGKLSQGKREWFDEAAYLKKHE